MSEDQEHIEQREYISHAFDTPIGGEENYLEEEKPKERKKGFFSRFGNKIWGLQVKIWSIILLLFGMINMPYIFFVIEPRDKDHPLEFMLKFNWEPLITCLLTLPTAIFGIYGGFRENITSLKIFIVGLALVIVGRLASSITILIVYITRSFVIVGIILSILSICIFTIPCVLIGICAFKDIRSIQKGNVILEEQYANLEDDPQINENFLNPDKI